MLWSARFIFRDSKITHFLNILLLKIIWNLCFGNGLAKPPLKSTHCVCEPVAGRRQCRGLHVSSFTWKTRLTRLPWWRSGWESACQCRGHGFKPWSGKIPQASEQLGPWATTTEPARLEPVLRNKRGRDSERPAHRDEEWPPLATTRENPRTETKTQHSNK